jgi:hypothetical protein
MAGRVEFVGSARRPSADALGAQPVVVRSSDGRDLGVFQVGRIHPDGRFTTTGLAPGRYTLTFPSLATNLPGWSVESIRIASVDRTVLPFDLQEQDVDVEVTFTDRAVTGDLAGIVRDAQGRPARNAAVFVFPVDRDAWVDFLGADRTMARVFTDIDGRYSATVRSGEYYAIALQRGFDDCWASTDQFERWAQAAVRVRVPRGPVATDLTVR